MDTWVIVLIVVVVVIVLALGAVAMSKRSAAAGERKREQARDHLQEAQVRTARADREQASAEEQAARARRETAEAEERAAVAEREAREKVAGAHEERSTAEGLRAKAEKLAPGMNDQPPAQHRADVPHTDAPPTEARAADQPPRADEPGGGATRR